jgi:hypothetical protein
MAIGLEEMNSLESVASRRRVRRLGGENTKEHHKDLRDSM